MSDAEAVGQVRLARQAIDLKHKAVLRAFCSLQPSVAEGIAFKSNAGYQRALDRLFAAMPIRPYAVYDRAVLYRSLRCVRAPFGDGGTHDYVEVAALVIGLSRGQAVRRDSPWGLLVSFHALSRLWERADYRFQNPAVDFAKAALQSHDTLLQCPFEVFEAARRNEGARWILPIPGSGGGLGCRVNYATADYDNDTIAMVRAATFLSAGQYFPNQAAQAAAVLFRPSANPIGQGVMLPPQLRNHAPRNTDGMAPLTIALDLGAARKSTRLPSIEVACTAK